MVVQLARSPGERLRMRDASLVLPGGDVFLGYHLNAVAQRGDHAEMRCAAAVLQFVTVVLAIQKHDRS